ncbi:MAG: HAD-IA family hydrolase [Anaerolineae bacterium]|nr:HAD-IA family hydrolase [Anaerolineae bacterium]
MSENLEFFIKQLPEAILFDFDYTLADSSQGVVECINFALTNLGLPEVSEERACRTIGLSLPDTFQILTGQNDVAQSNTFVRLFLQQADEVMADLTALFSTVPPTVTALKKRGLKLSIVSTKFRRRIKTVLAREGLADSFDVIIGGEDVANHKPNPEGLQMALDKLGCAPADSLYVGDSITDAETAARAAIPFVAVLSGVTPKDAFRGYAVYEFLENVGQLPLLLGLLKTRQEQQNKFGSLWLLCNGMDDRKK